MKLENPFLNRKPMASTSFLLNYGEQHITVYQTLTRHSRNKRRPDDLSTQKHIVSKLRLQAYETVSPITEEQEQSVHCLSESNATNTNSFWKYLPKKQNHKILNNPFLGSTSYSQFGPKISTSGQQGFYQQIRNEKQRIRKEAMNLKDVIRRRKNQSDRKGQLNHRSLFSVTQMYKDRIYKQSNMDPEASHVSFGDRKKDRRLSTATFGGT